MWQGTDRKADQEGSNVVMGPLGVGEWAMGLGWGTVLH